MESTPTSSLRTRSLEATLAIARRLAPSVGITRVTETTPLDRLGVPVFASIRPSAAPGSLCVSAGKGLTPLEAEVGAYMEAIELAWAEPHRTILRPQLIAARSLGAPTPATSEPWQDFLPQRPVTAETPVLAVPMENLRDGATWWVPAERVLFPVLPGEGTAIFGSDGNGLCSGNTRAEAVLHGLCEVIERDVTSMTFSVKRDTQRVSNATLPPRVRTIAARIETLGFELIVRRALNVFALPYFVAAVVDRAEPDHAYRGDGLHPDATIAVTRAVCEAFQSRLSDIHGGRDDLTLHRTADQNNDAKPAPFRQFFASLATGPAIDFASIPDVSAGRAIETATADLLERLAAQELADVLVTELAPPDLGIHIVRVVVPNLECSVGMPGRMGRRLAAAKARYGAR